MVVCVRGEGGMVGYGPAAASRETANLITHEVAPLLVENDFATLSFGFLGRFKLGSRALAALGAVEVALILGKGRGCRSPI